MHCSAMANAVLFMCQRSALHVPTQYSSCANAVLFMCQRSTLRFYIC